MYKHTNLCIYTQPSEPVPKNTGKKRQYLPVTGNAKEEKQRNLDILEKLSKPPVLDVTKVILAVVFCI